MRRRSAILAIAVTLVLALPASGGSVGMFGGKVVEGAGKNPPGKWLYVKGRAGMLRRVEISKARFEYADSVPRSARAGSPADDLKDGALVQVAAEQEAGEWVARSVLILRLSDHRLVRSSIH
jgi:hypothetical protein